MAGILDSVDQRTRLVGQNRLEILMFRLGGRQKFAINVFKVQEVVQLPKMTLMPHRHSSVCGVVNLRGQTLPVVDLSRAIGLRPLVPDERSTIIVTEYNAHRTGVSGRRRGSHRQPELGRSDATANHGRSSALPHIHH